MIPLEILNKIDTIIFDFDGTLHNGELLSLPIFHRCLSILYEKFSITQEFPSDEIILSQFGKPTEEIYPSLLKTNDLKIINTFGKCVEESEIEAFKSGKGQLYPQVEMTLTTLKKRDYKLAMCTNAREDYLRAAIDRFHLDYYFDIIMAAGQYPGKDKTWMVGKIIEKIGTENFAVVGDRYHDIEAAKNNDGMSIGCAYGFGRKEVENADIIISKFKRLLNIFTKSI